MLRLLPVLALVLAACSSPRSAPSGGGGSGGSAPPAEICDDRQDNDGNGLVDCADPACAGAPGCPACGDGFLDPREACDADNLNGASCQSLGFNGGGVLTCSATCTLDTSGCFRHEDCATPGDEDRNGLADCRDPLCAALPGCLTLTALDPPPAPSALSTAVVGFLVADGSGHPLGGQKVGLLGPRSSSVPAAPAVSGTDGVAQFTVRLGPSAAPQTFTATLTGTDVTATVTVDPLGPSPGTVVTVLDADRIPGADASGLAVAAHVGAPRGVQVAGDGTIYVAESCRVLAIAPDGSLSAVAGTGSCGVASADASDPLQTDLTIGSIALDEPRKALYIADGAAGLVRAVDVATSRMVTVAGGGNLVPMLGPTSLAVDPSGRVWVYDGLTRGFQVMSADRTSLSSPLHLPGPDCVWSAVVSSCSGNCSAVFDAAGNPFVTGSFCTSDPNLGSYTGPGVARYVEGQVILVAGKTPGVAPSGVPADLAQLPGATASAFDAAGNLYLLAGDALYRVDGVTGIVRKLAGGVRGFAGENAALGGALFSAPSALAFGPGGDLYVADTGNGVLRRVVGLGASMPTLASVQPVSGDGQTAIITRQADAPLVFRIVDGDGHVLAGQQPFAVTGDGASSASTGARTDATGQSQVKARMGLAPGPVAVSVYLSGIHGTPAGTPAIFALTGVEPAPGTLLVVMGGGDQYLPPAGKQVPATASAAGVYWFRRGPDGTIYGAGTSYLVKVDPHGVLSRLGGNGNMATVGTSGPATEASFAPEGLVLDAAANLLHVADPSMVRTIDLSTGLLSVLAGPGTGFDGDGDGGPALNATFGSLSSIERESSGAIDLGSYSAPVRRIDPGTGIISSIVPMTSCTGGGVAGRVYTMREVDGVLWLGGVACVDGYPRNALMRRDADGSLTIPITNAYVTSIAPAPDGSLTLGTTYEIDRFDPGTGTSTVLYNQGLNYGVWGLDYDADGHLWLADGRLLVIW